MAVSCMPLLSFSSSIYRKATACTMAVLLQDGDFAIAKALQEQERAFLTLQSMLRRNAR